MCRLSPLLPGVVWTLFLCMLLMIAVVPTSGAAISAVSVRPVSKQLAPVTFQVVEWIVDPGRTYANPFDPDEIAIDATFSGPDGKVLVVPGFWSAECKSDIDQKGREKWSEAGPGHWLIRACLTAPGDWRMVVSVKDNDGVRSSDPLSIHVNASDNPGFIHRATDNNRYLQYDSGKPYFAVGLDIGWAGHAGSGDFNAWFSHLADKGGNFARIWLWWSGHLMETQKTGLGRYDLTVCAYYDRVLQMARERGIGCMLTFNNHSQLMETTSWGPGDWPRDPYNSSNGGPATRPTNFFDCGPAREFYKRRLRYLVARYSAFTSVMAWELWNEQDVSNIKMPTDWMQEMASYLHSIDPYHHLVTTSYGGTGDKKVWALPEIDLTQSHLYGDDGSLHDTVGAYAQTSHVDGKFNKPWLLAELGISWRGDDSKFDPNGIGTNIHNGLWAGALLGGLGGGCSWWWDSYVEPKNVWHVYDGLAKFAASVDWPRRNFQPVAVHWARHPDTQPVTYSDVTLPAVASWRKADGKPITINEEGEPSASIPGTLFGPQKKDMRVPVTINVNPATISQFKVKVGKVSTGSTLRITVDDAPSVDFVFDAKPGGANQVSTTQQAQYHNWIATFDRDCSVDLTPGRHTIVVDNVLGDWMEINSITLTHVKSSLISDVRPLALQDAATGETVVWLQDVNSNWFEDLQGTEPRVYEDLSIALPETPPGSYRATWWDTRRGEIVRVDPLVAKEATLSISIPRFSRDIALHLIPIDDGTKHSTAALANKVEAQLRAELKLFYPRCVDSEHGGFVSNFAEDWTPGPQTTKQLVFQSRMTWMAAEVALKRPDLADEYLGYARHGLNFLADTMWDSRDGGFFWCLDGTGQIDPKFGEEKHAYGISFAIYAAAQTYLATHDPKALDLARRGFLWFDDHAHDSEHGGYFEALSRDGKVLLAPPPDAPRGKVDRIGTPFGFKSMNTHIHLLESITALYRAWPDPLVKKRLAELLELVRDHIAVSPGCLNMYLTPDWRPVPAADSFGHDVETAYLLIEADEALNGSASPATLAVSRSLVDHALDVGWDRHFGGFYNEGTFDKMTDPTKVWWVQAEGLNALLLMHQRFGSQTSRYIDAFNRQWSFILDKQIDSVHGGWFDEVDADGTPKPGRSKAQDWKACYHTGRALLNVADALREMNAPTKP